MSASATMETLPAASIRNRWAELLSLSNFFNEGDSLYNHDKTPKQKLVFPPISSGNDLPDVPTSLVKEPGIIAHLPIAIGEGRLLNSTLSTEIDVKQYIASTQTSDSGKDEQLVMNIGIVGAGVSGLFTAMIFDHLNEQLAKAAGDGQQSLYFKYKIFEANPEERVGGRLFTYKFDKSKNPHDYVDVGATRFPDNPIMRRYSKHHSRDYYYNF